MKNKGECSFPALKDLIQIMQLPLCMRFLSDNTGIAVLMYNFLELTKTSQHFWVKELVTGVLLSGVDSE